MLEIVTILYSVAPGDTLSSIARNFGTTVNDIARYNGISDPDIIYPGQTLRIAIPENATPEWYVVREGDTLYSIANKFNTTVDRLAQLNDIKNPNLIYPRKRLRIRP